MSEKRYKYNCLYCGKPYVSKRVNSRFCSGSCRAKYAQEKKVSKYAYLNYYADCCLKDGLTQIRMETIRNGCMGQTPDNVDTGLFVFKRVDQYFYSVERISDRLR